MNLHHVVFRPSYENYATQLRKLKNVLVQITGSIPVIWMVQPAILKHDDLDPMDIHRYNLLAQQELKYIEKHLDLLVNYIPRFSIFLAFNH